MQDEHESEGQGNGLVAYRPLPSTWQVKRVGL